MFGSVAPRICNRPMFILMVVVITVGVILLGGDLSSLLLLVAVLGDVILRLCFSDFNLCYRVMTAQGSRV